MEITLGLTEKALWEEILELPSRCGSGSLDQALWNIVFGVVDEESKGFIPVPTVEEDNNLMDIAGAVYQLTLPLFIRKMDEAANAANVVFNGVIFDGRERPCGFIFDFKFYRMTSDMALPPFPLPDEFWSVISSAARKIAQKLISEGFPGRIQAQPQAPAA